MNRLPFCADSDYGTVYFCDRCDEYKLEKEFYACSIRCHDRRCKECRKALNREAKRVRTQDDPCQLLLRRTRHMARKHGIQCTLDVIDVRLLVQKTWMWRSALSPKVMRRLSDLILIPWFANRPLTPWNAVLVTSREGWKCARGEDVMGGPGFSPGCVEELLRYVARKYQRYIGNLPPDVVAWAGQNSRCRAVA